MKEENKIFNTAIYMRLSKEDGDKSESDSITNQRNFIKEYLKDISGICIASERVDDGYSGVNFDRPAFQLMLHDINEGSINCVVVKDLSRFGRNYIEAGRYIERLFPFLGVRFIAINDNYDSAGEVNLADSIIIPFKNLMNDEYAKDISIKIRSHLDIKRKNGEFTGSFVTYGYMKSKDEKNKLIVDDYASKVVQDIFQWKLSGMSSQGIAIKLNQLGILSPMEYKEDMGLNYSTSFKLGQQAKWTATAIRRILQNEIYVGTLEQGKESTINYKIKTRIKKSKDAWIRCENSHEPIIDNSDFNTVKHLLEADTRISPNEKEVYLLSGILKCGDCQQNMIRKSVPTGQKKYIYYICSTNKAGNCCTGHRINNTYLEEAVRYSLKLQIEQGMDWEKTLVFLQTIVVQKENVGKISERIDKKQDEIAKYENFMAFLYEDFITGIINREEYDGLKENYKQKLQDAKEASFLLYRELSDIQNNSTHNNLQAQQIDKVNNMKTIDRKFVVTVIDHITIFEGSRIEIVLKFQDEYEQFKEQDRYGQNQ